MDCIKVQSIFRTEIMLFSVRYNICYRKLSAQETWDQMAVQKRLHISSEWSAAALIIKLFIKCDTISFCCFLLRKITVIQLPQLRLFFTAAYLIQILLAFQKVFISEKYSLRHFVLLTAQLFKEKISCGFVGFLRCESRGMLFHQEKVVASVEVFLD